ncbi:MAG: diacylglycerol kinase [Saprospiraceae bacterium]|nr:MAG: diacylglycerol kinase [Saprospiraceae bacterium]
MLNKRLRSFRYAILGMLHLFTSQTNARIHVVAATAAMAMGWYFGIDASEWMAIVIVVAMVFSAEAFNTAIEELTNLVSPAYHPLAGRAKDLAAAAVLITAIAAAAVGLIVFLPRVLFCWKG